MTTLEPIQTTNKCNHCGKPTPYTDAAGTPFCLDCISEVTGYMYDKDGKYLGWRNYDISSRTNTNDKTT